MTPEEFKKKYGDNYKISKKAVKIESKAILSSLDEIKQEFTDLKNKFKEFIGIKPRDFPKSIEVSNLKDIPEFPDEIEVKKPYWYNEIELKPIVKILEQFSKSTLNELKRFNNDEVLEAIKEIDIDKYKDKKEALAVRLVNEDKTRFYDGIGRGGGLGGGATLERIKIGTDKIISAPATEAKQDSIIAAVSPYDGATDDGTVALASANTWYAVPSGTAPTTAYELVVSIENADGTIRWSFNNGGTPSATNGNLAPNHLTIKMPANGVLYYGSSTAGDDVNFSIRQI